MDYHLIRIALIILVAIAFYAVLVRGLFNLTESARQKTLELGEKLCQSTQFPEDLKHLVYERLGEVYSHWTAWQLAFLMFKVLALMPFSSHEEKDCETNIPVHLRKDYDRFKTKWMVATVGNSPAALFLFATLVLISLACSASISAISTTLAGGHDSHHDGHGAKAT